jgi:hypothetical protein
MPAFASLLVDVFGIDTTRHGGNLGIMVPSHQFNSLRNNMFKVIKLFSVVNSRTARVL